MGIGQSMTASGLLKTAFVVGCIGYGILNSGSKSNTDAAAWRGPEAIDVVEEPQRVIFRWHGNVEEPLRARLEEEFDRFADDKREFVLSMNSPGGSVKTGFEIIQRIKREQKTRAINTVVEAHSYCGSMCVGIYLVGNNRSADRDAQFMFHEARISEQANKGEKAGKPTEKIATRERDVALSLVNTLLLAWYIEAGASKGWVERLGAEMRGGRDVTISARDLVGQRAGIVDRLL